MTADRRGGGEVPGRHHRLLLVVLVVVWAISWPVIKVGVTAMPPIWFAFSRYVIAMICLFLVVGARGELAFPSPPDRRLVIVSGVLQMGAYSALTAAALTTLPPGRASVLAFTTPLWVVPLAAWRLGERMTQRGLVGVALGLAGALVIASPAFRRGGGGQLLSYALLLGAAAAWAISIVYVRAHRFRASPLVLAPWQMLVAAALLGPLAIAMEGGPPAIGRSGIAALAYVGPVATAFAYWVVVEVGRRFRANTVSMALLATPSLGSLLSALTLGERVDLSLATGIILVGTGMCLATLTGSAVPSAARAVPACGSGERA